MTVRSLTPIQKISLERIYRLFELAEQQFPENRKRSNRYVQLARKISTKSTLPIPGELKKKFCRKCGAYLEKGKNARAEETERWATITCMECGKGRKHRK